MVSERSKLLRVFGAVVVFKTFALFMTWFSCLAGHTVEAFVWASADALFLGMMIACAVTYRKLVPTEAPRSG